MSPFPAGLTRWSGPPTQLINPTSIGPGEVRNLSRGRAEFDRDLTMALELDVAPVSLFDLHDRAVFRDVDFNRQAGDARDVGIRQRLAPDLEELAQRERTFSRRFHVNTTRRVVAVRVDRVEAVGIGYLGLSDA